MRIEPIVIVGAGPAGCAAAIQSKRLGYQPLLIDRTGRSRGLIENAFSVENYPGFSAITGPALADKISDQLADLKIPVLRGEVTAIDLERTSDDSADGGAGSCCNFILQVQSETRSGTRPSILAGVVIVATGTYPLQSNLPGANSLLGSHIFSEVRPLLTSQIWTDDSNRSNRRVLVIGGGEAALNYSLTLAEAGTHVDLLVRSKSFRARGKLLELVDHNRAIDVHFQSVSKEIIPLASSGEAGQSAGSIQNRSAGLIELKIEKENSPMTMQADAILFAIGRRSRSGELVAGHPASPKQSIFTGTTGLFVIGDARYGGLGQVAIAAGDGLAAAMAAAQYLEGKTVN